MASIKISGKVYDSTKNNVGVENIAVYISKENGLLARDPQNEKNFLGTKTNSEGKFELEIPLIKIGTSAVPVPVVFGNYITAKIPVKSDMQSYKPITKSLDLVNKKVYDFDTKETGLERQIETVPITDFENKPVTTAGALPKKKSLWWLFVVLGAGAIFSYTYFSKKGKK
jgi:hypothetical protein